MWRSSRLRSTVVLASAACALTSCAASSGHDTSGGGTAVSEAGGLTVSAVVHGRFVTPVDLDGGDFVVQPPGDTRAHVSPPVARAMFAAADAATGDYPFSLLGLGVVTMSSAVPSAPDPLPGSGASSSATSTTAPTSAPASTATTATARAGVTNNNTTTTTTPASTTTVAAPPGVGTTGTGPPVHVPAYKARLAWVGLAWRPACASADTHAKGMRLVAVVFDAQTGRDVVAYTSGASGCGTGSGGPEVSVPDELVSVPWQPVGPASTAVVATLPACSTYYGWTELSGQDAGAVQVVARRPYEPYCSPATQHSQTVDDVVPLGSGQSQVRHAPLGPIDALHNLPSA